MWVDDRPDSIDKGCLVIGNKPDERFPFVAEQEEQHTNFTLTARGEVYTASLQSTKVMH